jgi:hypothetical protein
MEARSIQASREDLPPPMAKDGGVAAGISAVIREFEHLLTGAGGLVVVAVGVIAVMTITTASLGTVAEEERATVATAAFTVLGTIVGAYFGVRVGARGREEAEAARAEVEVARAVASAKVERLAAHVPAQQAEEVLDAVDHLAHEGTFQPPT